MALSTVQDYVTAARTLLQDEQLPYRYTDAELAEALGFTLQDIRTKRPELFADTNGVVPDINRTSAMGTGVAFEPMYQEGLMWGMVGRAMMRDEEESSQQQAASYMAHFTAKLLTLAG